VAANPQTKPVDLGCESAENWQLSSTSTIAVVIITQPVGWYSFYRPTKGGRLSRPKHCSKGAQPVPKAVYRSSCRDKHNCRRRDSNLGPLTPKSDTLTTRPLRPADIGPGATSDVYDCAVDCGSDASSWLRRGRRFLFLPDDVRLRLCNARTVHASTPVVRRHVGGGGIHRFQRGGPLRTA